MLGEREYMNRNPHFYGSFKKQYPALFWVLAINICAFVLEILVSRFFGTDVLSKILSLSIGGLKTGFVWEFFTYSILHGGFMHLFLNMLAIFFVGRFVEAKLEAKNFTILYLMGIFIGGVFWAISTYAFLPNTGVFLCGASAGTLALITFFCLVMPDRPLTFLIFFVIPVSLRPKIMLYFLLGYEVFSYATMETAGLSGVANSAHLGGILGGYLFFIMFKSDFLSNINLSILKPKSMKMRASDLKYSVNMVNVEDLKKEANRILEKVEKKGLNSLSEEERDTLKQYREYI